MNQHQKHTMKLNWIFFLLSMASWCQNDDYINYHKQINKAEELFFMEKNADSALYHYEKVFSGYKFIFAKDLVNAAQIAIFSGRPSRKYIEQGFEQGLKLSHLKKYPLFSKVLPYWLSDKKMQSRFQKGRKKYLERIDFKYLDWIYKLAIDDQRSKQSRNYAALIYKATERLRDSIIKKGFPGDRLIGISDSTIFSEINKPHLDLYEQRKKHKELSYMTSDEHILSPNWPQIILVHNSCSYALYKDVLLGEIKKGNIHPRDVALIYDNMHRFKDNLANYCNNISLKGAYRLNMFTEYTNLTSISETNQMRKSLHIVSIEVDAKKQEFETRFGFRLFSGFWGSR